MTPDALEKAIAAGSEGLLDRVFRLMAEEIDRADPQWSAGIALPTLNADSFSDAWFRERHQHDPFHWAQANLMEVERNKREKYTVPWRYVILRLHEAVQEMAPHLDARDSQRFSDGLAGCSSIITPLFRQSRSAACWRFAKPERSAFSPSARLPDGDRRGQNGDYHAGKPGHL